MSGYRTPFLLLLCTLFVGCANNTTRSSDAGESRPADAPAPAVAKASAATKAVAVTKEDTRPVLLVFGDSLSEVGSEVSESYPDLLQKTLDEKGYKYHVVNLGVSGDTTTDGVVRIQPAVSLKPQLVLLELGGNDGLRGIATSITKQNLEILIATLQKAGAQVVLAGMTLPPNYGSDYIKAFEGMYRDLAAKYKLTLIPFLLVDLWTHIREHPEWMSSDGIHPTPAGNHVVAATVMKTLEPILKRRNAS